ncbi:MAG TPA: EVE domain-containing protein, partial [Alteromonas sp.]|nr:EVE domain-containing protein [Alteromonas sp.]
MRYWLFKSEPDVFGIDHLAQRPDQTEPWDGVRNYQARNFLRDEVGVGDKVFF